MDIIYEKDHVSFLPHYTNVALHSHYMTSLTFSLEGTFMCEIEGKTIKAKGLIIRADVEHRLNEVSAGLLKMMFDISSARSEELKATYLKERNYSVINCDLFNGKDISDVRQADEMAMNYLFPDQECNREYDGRIKSAIDKINRMDTITGETIHGLSEEAFLSQSRFSQLFKSEVGVNLSSYLVLSKMRKSFEYVLDGENITTAAIHAGFNSSSHLSATCMKMFGIRFTDLIK